MDRTDDLPEPLLRLKIHIWVHSAIGAALLVGLPTVALVNDRQEFAIGVLPALFVWSFGYGPLRRKAVQLAPEDRIPAKGLPPWITSLLILGGFLSPFWLGHPLGAWVVAPWLLFGTTIALRWLISRKLAIPVHGETWYMILAPLSFWALFLGFLFTLLLMVGME